MWTVVSLRDRYKCQISGEPGFGGGGAQPEFSEFSCEPYFGGRPPLAAPECQIRYFADRSEFRT